jgi:hypothetical protein
MPLYKYQPFYKYDGPTHAQPFRDELSSDEEEQNIEDVFSEVETYFDDEAKFERKEDGFIHITSDVTQTECDEQVKRCLNSLDLYANRIAAK